MAEAYDLQRAVTHMVELGLGEEEVQLVIVSARAKARLTREVEKTSSHFVERPYEMTWPFEFNGVRFVAS